MQLNAFTVLYTVQYEYFPNRQHAASNLFTIFHRFETRSLHMLNLLLEMTP